MNNKQAWVFVAAVWFAVWLYSFELCMRYSGPAIKSWSSPTMYRCPGPKPLQGNDL